MLGNFNYEKILFRGAQKMVYNKRIKKIWFDGYQ